MPSKTGTAYGAIAGAYDAILTFSGFKRGVEHFLDRLDLPLPPRARILDAGCGTGLLAFHLAERFPEAEVTACDLDPEMLRSLERIRKERRIEGNVVAYQGDLRDPAHLRHLATGRVVVVPQGYFDAVFVSGAFEHVPLGPSAEGLTRLLKPGGTFFTLWVRRNPVGAVLGMVWRFRPYSVTEMRRALADAGLEQIRVLRLGVEDFPANLTRIAIIAKKLKSQT